MKFSPRIALFLSVCLAFGSLSHSARAQVESTPSASSRTATENLKQRIIETINQVDEAKSPDTFGYVGKVRDIVQNTIVIEDKSGKKNILVTEATEIVRSPGTTEIKLENVRIDDGIIAIGSPADNPDEINGKRIIVSSELFSPPAKATGIAKITAVAKTSMTLAGIGTGTTTKIAVTAKTAYKSKTGPLELSDMSPGDTVVYSALADEKDPTKLTATVVLVTAQENPDVPEEEVVTSTPSASPKSSPKASPKI